MRIVFFGTPGFAATTLDAVLRSRHDVVGVVAQPDRKAGRGMKVHRPETATLAESRGIPVLQPAKIRTEEFLAAIRAMQPDAGVVVAYGRILPAALLEIPRHGFLNVHGSILPAWRGAAPIQRAIENGDTETGVSIMQLDEELDHGPVFEIARTPIGPDERSPQLFDRLAVIGGEAIVRVLDAIDDGTARATEQNHSLATIAPKIEKHEGLVDLGMPARTIYDRFRAFDPWPGLSLVVGDETVRIVDMKRIDISAAARPGTVLSIDPDGVAVATGAGAICLTKLQRPGKGPVSAADFARGRRIETGARLA